MSSFPYPLFVADIGGTNARFAWAQEPKAPLSPVRSLATADFPGLVEALEETIEWSGLRPASILVCAAGPVSGRVVKLTNSDWFIDGRAIAKNMGLQSGLLFNDFEALALSLPSLEKADVRNIGSDSIVAAHSCTRIIVGPGTGLGIAALLSCEDKLIPLPSEAGHTGIAADSAQDALIFECLDRPFGRVTAETILCGQGLVRLHRARLQAVGRQTGPLPENPADIVATALTDPASDAAGSVRQFWDITARFAGDMALAFLSTGGVTLAGGILPRLTPLLDAERFRTLFEAKTPMAALCARIPTQLLTNTDAVLKGMRRVADNPDSFLIDFKGREWR